MDCSARSLALCNSMLKARFFRKWNRALHEWRREVVGKQKKESKKIPQPANDLKERRRGKQQEVARHRDQSLVQLLLEGGAAQPRHQLNALVAIMHAQ